MAVTFRRFSPIQKAAVAFYTITGIMLLAFLPITAFAPHIGFLGVVSLMAAYSFFAKRVWAPWLAFMLLVSTTVFAVFTVYSIGLSNMLVTLSMFGYLVLTWLVTVMLLRRRR